MMMLSKQVSKLATMSYLFKGHERIPKTKSRLKLIIIICALLPMSSYAWDNYFDSPEYHDVKMSPNGKQLAIVAEASDTGKRGIIILDVDSGTVTGGVKLPSFYQAGPFNWVSNKRIALKLLEPAHKADVIANYMGEIYAVNIDGSQGQIVFGERNSTGNTGTRIKSRESTKAWGDVVDGLSNNEKKILISSEPWNAKKESYRTLYQLDTFSGILSKKTNSAPATRTKYIVDKSSGALLAASGLNSDNQQQLFYFNNNEWKPASPSPHGNKLQVVGVDSNSTYLYCIDNIGESKSGIYRLTLSSGEYKKIYQHDTEDIGSILLSPDTGSVYGVRLDNSLNSHVYLKNTAESKIHKSLNDIFPNKYVTLTDKNSSGTVFVIHVGDATSAGEFFLFNNDSGDLKSLVKPKIRYQFERDDYLGEYN